MKRVVPFTSSRRSFLRASAGAALLPSLLAGLASSSARAQAAPPKRLVLVFSELGWVRQNLIVTRPDMPTRDDVDFDFSLAGLADGELSPILRPLARHKDRLTVIDGLSLVSAIADREGDAHARGWNSAFTGDIGRQEFDVKALARSPSIDQIIGARDLARGTSTLPSLGVGIDCGWGDHWPGGFSNFHFGPFYALDAGGVTTSSPADGDPSALFDRLFTAAPPAQRESRTKVIDVVSKQLLRMRSRVSAADRNKLDTHADLIAGLKNRIEIVGGCASPVRLSHTDGPDPANASGSRYHQVAESFFDLVAASLSCGATRVATMQLHSPPNSLIGGDGDIHHDYSHPSDPANTGQAADEGRRVMTNINVLHAGMVASFVDRLRQIPDGAGGSLLDSTAVVWVNEIAHGNHGHENWPVVIVGDMGGELVRGRYLRVGQSRGRPRGEHSNHPRTGLAHNHLLTSLVQGMGVDVDAVGLRQVEAVDGSNIDLTGPFRRVMTG